MVKQRKRKKEEEEKKKEFLEKLKAWQDNGFDVTRLENISSGNLAVILPAAYLHDIGIKEAERKCNSTAAPYQEEEGPPVSREILGRLGADPVLVEEVCDIVAYHHHPRAEETTNFKCVYDADLIANMEEKHETHPIDPEPLAGWIDRALLTRCGKELARKVFPVPGLPMMTTLAGGTPGTPPRMIPRPPCSCSRRWPDVCTTMWPAISDKAARTGRFPAAS
jgi:hypothetical protein